MFIKNLEKYKNIKLAKGIFLDNVQTSKRVGDIGVSTRSVGHKWFALPKGKALFKSFDTKDGEEKRYRDGIRKNRIINEFICEELCKQVGLSCANHDPANYHNTIGLVSYNVMGKGQRLINALSFFEKTNGEMFYSNDIKSYAKAIDVINQNSGKQLIDKDKMLKHLFKIVVFDSLTMQTDRHLYNVFFLEDKATHKITVAPLIDNEFAFFSIGLENGIFYDNKEIDMDDLIYTYSRARNRIRIQKQTGKFGQDFTLKDIAILAKTKNDYKAILEDMLNNINIQEAVQNVEKLGFVISDEYKQFMEDIISGVKQSIIKEYKNLEKITGQIENIL